MFTKMAEFAQFLGFLNLIPIENKQLSIKQPVAGGVSVNT
jgi:hypothetical protein